MSPPGGDLRARVHALVAESARLEPARIDDTATFVGDLALESVEIITLVCRIEKTFQIALSAETLAPVRTVGELVRIVEERAR